VRLRPPPQLRPQRARASGGELVAMHAFPLSYVLSILTSSPRLQAGAPLPPRRELTDLTSRSATKASSTPHVTTHDRPTEWAVQCCFPVYISLPAAVESRGVEW